MAGGFTTRRDSSANNVPVVGYQDSADAQDIILWAAVQVTETGNTDAQGNFRATNLPIIDASHDWVVDGGGVPRQRLIDGKDITAKDSGGTTLYPGTADGRTGVIPLYTDSGHTTSAANKLGVQVTYWTLRPVSADAQGRLVVSMPDSLPAGTNRIGAVVVRGVTAGGSEVPLRVDDSGQLMIALSDLIANAQTSSGMERLRIPDTIKYKKCTAAGDNTVWTPAAGKSIVLMGIWAQSNIRGTSWTLPDTDMDIKMGSTVIGHMKLMGMLHFQDNSVTGQIPAYVHAGQFQIAQMDFGQGTKFPPDTPLIVSPDSAVVQVTAWGLEV
jgi:hypothetical protein